VKFRNSVIENIEKAGEKIQDTGKGVK